MKTKTNESKDLTSMFLKKVDPKKLSKPDHKEDLIEDELEKKYLAETEEQELKLEKIEGPLFVADLKQKGLTPKEYFQILDKRDEEKKKYKDKFGAIAKTGFQVVRTDLDIARAGSLPSIGSIQDVELPNCTTIEVRVCKTKVCVNNKLPIDIDEIYRSNNSDGNFTLHGNDGFGATDHVEGYSTQNLNYHTHKRYHRGWININCSTELAESAVVNGIGISFDQIMGNNGESYVNGGLAWGDQRLFKANSWGRVEKSWRIRIEYQKPGEAWTRWFWPDARVPYINHWNDQEINRSGFAFNMWADHHPNEVLGQYNVGTAHVHRHATFPAGTIFRVYMQLNWKLTGRGNNGEASVFYALRARPYILVESCTLQYPNSITINPNDYLP